MIEVTICLNNSADLKYVMNSNTKIQPYLTIYDERYKDDKKRAWALKNEYGARECPFIEIKKDGKLFKMIYKEATQDPIGELIKTLNDDIE